MSSLDPCNVVYALVQVLLGILWRIRVGSDIEPQLVESNVRECIQRGEEAQFGNDIVIAVAVVAYAQFVGHRRREGVILAESEKIVRQSQRSVEDRERHSCQSNVGLGKFVPDEASPDLVLIADVVVDTRGEGL